MPLKAIQTLYAGCRFRSRLEARWAVFFDAMGIRWEYEPQGIECSYRLSLDEGTFPYLPDFWLPDLGLWAEVKGTLNDDELLRLLDAAAHLSTNGGGGCHDRGEGHDVLVLPSIPRPDALAQRRPFRLHMHKGDLTASPWPPTSACVGDGYSVIASDYGGDLSGIIANRWTPGWLIEALLIGSLAQDGTDLGPYRSALTAARSARFEHGETPVIAR
jgi:hypothetical protein